MKQDSTQVVNEMLPFFLGGYGYQGQGGGGGVPQPAPSADGWSSGENQFDDPSRVPPQHQQQQHGYQQQFQQQQDYQQFQQQGYHNQRPRNQYPGGGGYRYLADTTYTKHCAMCRCRFGICRPDGSRHPCEPPFAHFMNTLLLRRYVCRGSRKSHALVECLNKDIACKQSSGEITLNDCGV